MPNADGAAAAVIEQAYPDLYAAVGVHSGLACGAARDMPSAFAAMRQGASTTQQASRGVALDSNRRLVRTIVFHVNKDHTVNPGNGDQVIARPPRQASCGPRCSSARCRAAKPTPAPTTPMPVASR